MSVLKGIKIIMNGTKQSDNKKFNFIKRWMYNLTKDVHEYHQPYEISEPHVKVSSLHASIGGFGDVNKTINFAVHFANGGRVVEITRYDKSTHESTKGLYIITPDRDFGIEIDKIIMMEGLR